MVDRTKLDPRLVYPPEYFEEIAPEEMQVCERTEEIHDEVFKGKPIGFFRDALIRLRKNKASIAAFWVILLIVVMAVFAPDFNEFTFSQQMIEEGYVNMPPKVSALSFIPLLRGERVLQNKRVAYLDDPEKYPEGCVIEILNRRVERNIEMCDVRVDYYKYLGVPEGTEFWFGTDGLGRDTWTRMWRGARVSLIIAFTTVLTDIFIGVIYGAVSGYYGGKIDMVMMRICEVITAIPNLVIMTLAIMMLGPGIRTMILAMVLRGWVGTARLVRTQFLRYKNREYVMSARTMGVPDRKLVFRHILPNTVGPLITRSMVAIPAAIFSESFLSYIGLGIPAPEPSIGNMLSDAQSTLLLFPEQTLFPALLISILMIAFNLFSNGLRDAFDPTQRGVE